VCSAIKEKAERKHQVWFLSGCGLYEHTDPRRTSIPSALDFASTSRMEGVVVPAVILMKNESMVDQAASMGLRVMTYGLENDDRGSVVRQKELGVAGAIIDNVEGLMPL
jgi:glycerophosphodiester phosphodiesterase